MKNEICVSASALGIGGGVGEPPGGGGVVTPEAGDEVEFSGKGRVTRVEGGNAYVEATEINGQPVVTNGAGEGGLESEGAALDDEMAGYAKALGLVVFFLFLMFGGSARAEKTLEQATTRTCSGTQVSNYVAVATQTQVYQVLCDNHTGATLYLLVFDSPTNSLAGRTPHVTNIPVPTGTVGFHDFGSSGLPCDFGVNVCLSTTPYSLTNASGGGTVTVIHSGGRR